MKLKWELLKKHFSILISLWRYSGLLSPPPPFLISTIFLFFYIPTNRNKVIHITTATTLALTVWLFILFHILICVAYARWLIFFLFNSFLHRWTFKSFKNLRLRQIWTCVIFSLFVALFGFGFYFVHQMFWLGFVRLYTRIRWNEEKKNAHTRKEKWTKLNEKRKYSCTLNPSTENFFDDNLMDSDRIKYIYKWINKCRIHTHREWERAKKNTTRKILN